MPRVFLIRRCPRIRDEDEQDDICAVLEDRSIVTVGSWSDQEKRKPRNSLEDSYSEFDSIGSPCSLASECDSGSLSSNLYSPAYLPREVQPEAKTLPSTSDYDVVIPLSFMNSPSASEARLSCGVCGKYFKRMSSLSTHRLIHTNIKPFQCRTCDKSFLRKSDLKKHDMMHSGNKPHRCDICGKEFSQSSNMLTHLRRHSGVKPFACQICGRAFYRKVDVRRHTLRHKDGETDCHS